MQEPKKLIKKKNYVFKIITKPYADKELNTNVSLLFANSTSEIFETSGFQRKSSMQFQTHFTSILQMRQRTRSSCSQHSSMKLLVKVKRRITTEVPVFSKCR